LSSLIHAQDTQALVHMQLRPDLFRDNEATLFALVTDHLTKHGKIPHPDTVETELGDVLVETEEPPSYYLEGVEKRYLQTKMKSAVISAQDFLKDEDPESAFKFITDVVSELQLSRNRTQIHDYALAAEMIEVEYMKQHTAIDETGIFYGWPYLDKMTTGMQPGDFNTIVGRPAAGKTFLVLRGGLHEWKKQKGRPVFFSMEMPSMIINQRLASMDSKKPLTHLLKGALTSKAFKHMMSHLQDNKQIDRPFWVVDAKMVKTVQDVANICRQLKPTSVRVDAAYLLRSENQKIGRFERITENAEMLKQLIATDLGIPVVASYQFKRGEKKKKKDTDGDDVYGSDAMLQLSTVMLGLLQEDSIETKKQRHIEVLKGRNGETGGFDIYWDFMDMGFDEIIEEDVQDLQFLN
jgi:replicative DNA helicase